MKKILTAFLLMTFIAPAAFAAEALTLEPVAAPRAAETPSYTVTVQGDGQLALKPGTVFTTGNHSADRELPYLISTPKPISYPRWALRQGWEGRFSIAIEVKLDGTVGRYKVMQSTGHEVLDKAATKAVLTWKFHPARKNGKAVVDCVQIPVNFEIKNN